MSKKSDLIVKLLDEHQFPLPLPKAPVEGFDLLEHGMYMVLLEHLTPTQAEASVRSLRSTYVDWNELRVSQVQEIAQSIKTSSRKTGFELLNELRAPAMAVKEYLQDVFQETHGLDLEFLRDDVAEGAKKLSEFKVLGLARGSYLLWLAGEGKVPLHLGLIKFLEKLDLGPKTSSVKKAHEAFDPLVPKGRELALTIALHDILERWNDEENPPFLTIAALRSTAFGKKAATDFENARAKAEAARQREDERLRKEEERVRKEEERARKKAEAVASKRASADAKAKARTADLAKKAAERVAKIKDAERKKVEAKKAADAKKAAEAKQKAAEAKKQAAEAKKQAAAAKKAAAKPAASKAAKKTTAKVSSKAKSAPKKTAKKVAKQSTAKKAGSSKVAKKPTAKKAAAKPAAKKSAAKKTAAKKTAAKKTAAKKTTAKKSTAKKTAAKKSASKKPAGKKSTAKKKAAKKSTKSRSGAR
ncbi:hypothetical protein [Engelhardtia mirabilis]|uniref:Histone H1-like nucleoprotein HC2 n=1 Tax=Engelhardtia mirabilis TaxID=2528011 RepID=A0A518BLY4_9BACT|nr:hypothetical protein Pla133_30470 [Planctomycetes bacterium Pla133]QDV02282.1 hypothetical protein Pla86_30460 [Planctomycetes bacterium Pla86]